MISGLAHGTDSLLERQLSLIEIPTREEVLAGPLGFRDSGVPQELADADGLALLDCVSLGGAGEERELVVGQSDGENLPARVPGGWPTGAGSHEHEVTVSQSLNLSQYDDSTLRIARTDLARYDKCMTTTAYDLLIQEMTTSPDVIESIEIHVPTRIYSMRVYSDALGKPLDLDFAAASESGARTDTFDYLATLLGDAFRADGDVSCYAVGPIVDLYPAATDQLCTHLTITPEHLAQCCAEGVDCDRCSTLITWERLGMTVEQVMDRSNAVLCANCVEYIATHEDHGDAQCWAER